MKIKLEEIMAFTSGILEEVTDGMYDWVIDDYKVEEDKYLRHYSFSLQIRQYFDEKSDIRSEYMNWNLQIDDDIAHPLYSEEEMGTFFIDWEKVHDFFIPYVWDNTVLLFIEKQLTYYQEKGIDILTEDDYKKIFTHVLGMYDDFCYTEKTYQDDESHIYSKVIN